MAKLENKVLLTFGAASGMAKATALLFAKEGAKVVVADVSEKGQDTVDEIKAAGGEAAYVQCDVMKEEAIQAAVDFAVKTYNALDIMQYQPGINTIGPIADLPLEQWNLAFALNITGAFLATQKAARYMMANNGGVILLTSSSNSTQAYGCYSAYCSSKAAVDMFARVASMEFGPKIRVNTINPGFMNTAMIAAYAPDITHDAELMGEISANQSIPKIGEADQYAKMALFLCSGDSDHVTGCNFYLDGGGHNYKYPDALPIVMGRMAAASEAEK